VGVVGIGPDRVEGTQRPCPLFFPLIFCGSRSAPGRWAQLPRLVALAASLAAVPSHFEFQHLAGAIDDDTGSTTQVACCRR
jgi:hypothetical protein